MKIFLCILNMVVLFNSVDAFWLHHAEYDDEYFFNQYEEIQAYEIAEVEELQKKNKSPEIDKILDKYEQVYADDITPLLRTLAIYRRKLQRLGFYPIVSDSGLRYFPANSDSFEIADEYDEQIYELLNRPKKPKRFKNGYRPSKKTKKTKDRQTLTTKRSNYRSEKFPVDSNRPAASKYQIVQPYREPYYETERPIVEMIQPTKPSKAEPTSTTNTHSGYYGSHTTTKNSYEEIQTTHPTQPSGSYSVFETSTFKYPQQPTETLPNTKSATTVILTETPHTTTYEISSTASSADIHSSYESNLIGPYFKEGSKKIPYRKLESNEQSGESDEILDTIENENGQFDGLLGTIIDMIGGENDSVEQSSEPARVITEEPLHLVETDVPDPEAIDSVQIGESALETTSFIVESTTELPTTATVDSFTLFPLQINFPTYRPIRLPTLATTQTSLTTESYLESPEPISENATEAYDSNVVQRTEQPPQISAYNQEYDATSTTAYEPMDISTAPYDELRIDNFRTLTELPIIEITDIKPETTIFDLQQQQNELTHRKEATTARYETPVLTDSPTTQTYQKQPKTTTQVPMTFLDLQSADQLQTDNPSVSAQEYTESIEYYGSATDPTAADDSSSSFSEAPTTFQPMITTTTPYDWDLDPKTENGRGFKGGGLNFLIEKVVPPPRRSDILIEDDDYNAYEDNTISVGK